MFTLFNTSRATLSQQPSPAPLCTSWEVIVNRCPPPLQRLKADPLVLLRQSRQQVTTQLSVKISQMFSGPER